MGQQQLLLLVLGIVIVGLAVVVGIQAFSEGQSKSSEDALTNDAARFVSDGNAWALKPTAMGGGGGDYSQVSFENLGYEVDANDVIENANGRYLIDGNPGGDPNFPLVQSFGCNPGKTRYSVVMYWGPNHATYPEVLTDAGSLPTDLLTAAACP